MGLNQAKESEWSMFGQRGQEFSFEHVKLVVSVRRSTDRWADALLWDSAERSGLEYKFGSCQYRGGMQSPESIM